MKTYIALLKGINVGGHNKVPMADLRHLLTTVGFKDVQTYIQSGNVILKSSETTYVIKEKIQQSIKAQFGFDISVIIKTRIELLTILDGFPFVESVKENSYFIMLNKTPNKESLKAVESIKFVNEEVVIINDALYFYSSVGYGKAKFNMNTYERKLNVIGTARNYNTMVKLVSLSAEN